jgi:predicted ArsR family transcriptional regulator
MPRLGRDARIAGVAALDQPLRRGLYDLVVQSEGWLGRDEAADAMDVPRSVAAFHLDKLVDAGLLEVRFERPRGRVGPGAGRPAKKYRRAGTEVSVSLPERHYELAGALLADAVLASSQTGCPVMEALSGAAHAAGAEVGAAVRAGLPKQVPTRKLRRAALDALRELGYEPREAKGQILLANCPFHALAERHRPLICGMNRDLLGGLAAGMEADDRLVPRLDPAPEMCCVRIATP